MDAPHHLNSRRKVKARLVLHRICRGQVDQTDGDIERSISVYLTRTEESDGKIFGAWISFRQLPSSDG